MIHHFSIKASISAVIRQYRLQPLLTLHSQKLLFCGPTRVHLGGRLGGEQTRDR